mmetsp:Transcript_38744/g.51052  ORF Transcript_38744/g.51052 Transcript_38744/m.51052 type:complete len:181 (+) Transcript_38744:118-660(+)|eukprot:CAMPEP_0117757526 /NCGR_PEP_ID=MMETSP0947-20121206/14790_1 /TAXON_ID=44440 /ORGANISM="Chattonella subsalsa, Strain CCMP2191" /LENGTH=180 /DNA_ID=CAMNT_0005577449 /DNA_START=45 /DNA_END=587 /DNA_ORIENTATION=+
MEAPGSNRVIKIVVCGPLKSGKSTITNILADQHDQLGQSVGEQSYRPTIGVRILEVEKEVFSAGKVTVELWDVSGDQRFESCWPAIQKDSNAVILVYNPDHPAHDQEVGLWYDYFVKGSKLTDDQCMAYMHFKDPSQQGSRSRPPPKLQNTSSVVRTSLDQLPLMTQSFEEFLRTVVTRS